MNNIFIKQSLKSLHEYCLAENYKGYSLYDSHSSPLPFNKFGPTISFLINQIIKRSPINVRKIIGVKKGYNPKGMGLFLHAYTLQQKLGNPLNIVDIEKKTTYFFNWLRNNASKGYSGYCWGYNYPWPKKDGSIVPTYTPSSVVSGFNIRAIFQYYLQTRADTCLKILRQAENFILNDIHRTKNDLGICFSYTPLQKDITINANLFAAEILAYSDFVSKKNDNQKLIKEVLDFTMNHQNSNGSWYYSYGIKTAIPKKQIDFHQGYILESIKRICDYSSFDIREYHAQIISGLLYYRHNQFTNEGVAYWRVPQKWPVDIHNQSQGIITFSLFKDYDPEFIDFAQLIFKWTIKNMQGSNGNFYYQKWPIITNKVPYMRWNQGWMLLALTTLLDNLNTTE